LNNVSLVSYLPTKDDVGFLAVSSFFTYTRQKSNLPLPIIQTVRIIVRLMLLEVGDRMRNKYGRQPLAWQVASSG
jgi:hypothetical protein